MSCTIVETLFELGTDWLYLGNPMVFDESLWGSAVGTKTGSKSPIMYFVRGVRLQALTVVTLVYSLVQRVLMTLLVLTFFSGVRIEVGEFCNSLTEVPCC